MKNFPECPPEFDIHEILEGHKAGADKMVYLTRGASSISLKGLQHHVVIEDQEGGHWLIESFYDADEAAEFARKRARIMCRAEERLEAYKAKLARRQAVKEQATKAHYANNPAWGAF